MWPGGRGSLAKERLGTSLRAVRGGPGGGGRECAPGEAGGGGRGGGPAASASVGLCPGLSGGLVPEIPSRSWGVTVPQTR